ncbi:class I SAM-dependent methyltransferase [Metabacillus idriensis]|uniref:class I SAM-dependent methyltransferase n=1 Tax=Metabacillus idriensis TaxID=324768 RepID=UPI00174A306B|nr:class I SAM-dependent methyltransferase [Metabacillus idriensis]
MKNTYDWEKEAEKKWDERAAFWNKGSKEMWDSGSRSSIVPFFSKYVNPEAEVIDIGCGDGYGSYLLTREGMNVTGVDLSPEMIKLAKKHEKPDKLEFIQANMLDLPFADEKADALLTINCIEWTEDPLAALNELKRVVKNDGYLCIAILGPTAHPRTNSFDRLYGKPVICNTMMPWEFEKMALENGWEQADSQGVYKRGVTEDMIGKLSPELKQSLSFLWLFMLQKKEGGNV